MRELENYGEEEVKSSKYLIQLKNYVFDLKEWWMILKACWYNCKKY